MLKEERENKRQIAAALADAEDSPSGSKLDMSKLMGKTFTRRLGKSGLNTPTRHNSLAGTRVATPKTPTP